MGQFDVFVNPAAGLRRSLVLVPVLSTIRRAELKQPIATLVGERSAVLAAIDYLFFGV